MLQTLKDQIAKTASILADLDATDPLRACWEYRLEELQTRFAVAQEKRKKSLQFNIESLEREIRNGFYNSQEDKQSKLQMIRSLSVDLAMLEFSQD